MKLAQVAGRVEKLRIPAPSSSVVEYHLCSTAALCCTRRMAARSRRAAPGTAMRPDDREGSATAASPIGSTASGSSITEDVQRYVTPDAKVVSRRAHKRSRHSRTAWKKTRHVFQTEARRRAAAAPMRAIIGSTRNIRNALRENRRAEERRQLTRPPSRDAGGDREGRHEATGDLEYLTGAGYRICPRTQSIGVTNLRFVIRRRVELPIMSGCDLFVREPPTFLA